MTKMLFTAMAVLSLSGGVAFANGSADTDHSRQGCPEMVYADGRATLVGPSGVTPDELAFLENCPKAMRPMGSVANPPKH